MWFKLPYSVLFSLIIGMIGVIYTAQSQPPTNHVYSQKITVENGLSQSDVNTILKDHEGFVWIGTDDGLNRFDGYTFKVFHQVENDSTSLGNDIVKVLFEDSKKRMWVGTVLGGLNLYNKETESFIRYNTNPANDNSLSQNSILCIAEDSKSNLWIGTYHGLNQFNPETGKFKRYMVSTQPYGLSGNNVNTIMLDDKNQLWIGTENGISILNTASGVITNVTTDQHGIPINSALNIFQDSQQQIWIATNGGGVLLYSEKNNSFTRFKNDPNDHTSISNNLVRKIIEDKDQTLWFGTDGGGVCIFDKNKQIFKRLASRNDPALLNAAIYDLYEDNAGILWIGTYGGGLKIINKSRKNFIHYASFDPTMAHIGKNSVLALAEDDQQNIWIGTDGAGLYKFNPFTKVFTGYFHDPKKKNTISSNVIKSLLIDKQGNVYAGTFGGGLNFIDRKSGTITHYLHDASDSNTIISDHVWYLCQDSDDRIWVGNLGGLDEFIPQKKIFKHYNFLSSTPDTPAMVYKVYEDKNKNIWIGTRDDGLNLLNKQTNRVTRFQSTLRLPGLNSNEIRDIIEDHNQKLWVATTSGGLNFFNPEKKNFEPLVASGLPAKDIVSILEDSIGNFWMGTFNGLVKFNPETNVSRIYDISDGLQGNEFNYSTKLKSSTGEFYFGGPNGLNIFKPTDIQENISVPPIVITKFYLFHKEVNNYSEDGILQKHIHYQRELVLHPEHSVITFQYTTLEYNLPKRNNYAYILEGFDKDWNYVGTQRTATYTSLPPGNYVFKVKATNNDGLWNEESAIVNIKVLPPWYRTGWVQILLLLSVITIVVGTIRMRTQLLLRQKRKLEIMVVERTHQIALQNRTLETHNEEIKNRNVKIQQQNDELKARNEEILTQREEIEEKSLQLERAHEEIQTVNDQLVKVNSNLEKLVDQRTAELQQAMKKLIETDEGLNTFLYRSSHDLRGPITTLMGLAELAKTENKQQHLAHYFDKMQLSCAHMLKLLKKLSDTNIVFRTTKNTTRINWEKIINDLLKELSKLDPFNSIQVIIENNITKDVYSDEKLITTIIQNLMENAIIFQNVENAYVKLILHCDQGLLTIQVQDNGIGIADDVKSKVFDMFYRGSEKSIGNGLGLFLVKKSVDLLNGQIEIDSKQYSFTGVTITVPL